MTAANRSFVILAIIWLLSIADTLDPDSTEQYDFEFDSSIYKIMLDTAPKIEAEKMCASFYNGGHLVIINQRSELDEMVKELLSRNVGEKLEYWVSGNTTQNTEFTSSILEFTSQTEECQMTMYGYEYRGDISVTREGLSCQRWDSQTPHPHNRDNLHYLGDATLQNAANHCRNPNLDPGGPWCFTTNPNIRWQYCNVPTCKVAECRITKHGAKYNGTRQTTETGKMCERWDLQRPPPDVSNFPDASLEDAHNYCRNPDRKRDGPWCYTTDPNTLWESCGIAYCWRECRVTRFGSEYMGQINETVAGLACQRWDMDYPHEHRKEEAKFPDASMTDAENYCRNPDMETHGVWCYTTDPDIRWQYCNVPMCTEQDVDNPGMPVRADRDTTRCKTSPHGWEYNGTVSTTITGLTCQRWQDQTPHPHSKTHPGTFPDETLEGAANYCRNPDQDSGGPWCYTLDPGVEWEYCDIPTCSDEVCTMLSQPDFKHHPDPGRVVLIPAPCNGNRSFICEQEQFKPRGCHGPCIGLLVSYPFMVALTIFITLVAYHYYTRRRLFTCGFNEQSDEIGITSWSSMTSA